VTPQQLGQKFFFSMKILNISSLTSSKDVVENFRLWRDVGRYEIQLQK
jgi:hypothetical protein